MRFITYILVFLLGGAGGIYWGVHHPSQAADIAERERVDGIKIRIAVAQAKIEALQQIGAASNQGKYQQMIDDQKRKLDEANKELGSQP